MATIDSPLDSNLKAYVDPTFAAIRASLWPREYNQLNGSILGGHFSLAVSTGLTTGVAAAGGLLSVRWTSTTMKMLLQRIKVSAVISTAFGTAQENSVDLVRIVNFSAADSGGTALVPINDNYKKRTNMQDSVISDARVSTTAALTDGTGTAKSASANAILPFKTGVVGEGAEAILFDVTPGIEAPLEIGAASGFRIRNLFAQGATGVVRFTFMIDWAEVPN